MYYETQFLMVEDNPDDIQVTEDFFKDHKISNLLSVVSEGMQALRFLRRQDEYESATVPDLIMVSLNLLKQDNASLLYQIKEDEQLQAIPVVVLTTEDGEETILGDNLPVNMSIAKPLNLACFSRIMSGLDDFWLTIVKQ